MAGRPADSLPKKIQVLGVKWADQWGMGDSEAGVAEQAGREENEQLADFEHEGGEVIVDGDGDVLQVIHAGAFEMLVGEEEAQRADEMEGGAGGGTETGDIAGVLGDFRLDQDNFEGMWGKHGNLYKQT